MIKSLFTTSDGKNRAFTFALICSLFLLWGVCNLLLDDLNKLFRSSLQLSNMQAAFVQGVWYSAYLFMAFPASWVARRFGYRGGILSGLGIVILGSLLFIPVTKVVASQAIVYSLFLAVLFVLATGLVFLETLANPYTTVLGPKETAVSRINLAQTCNGVGSIVGPYLGATFILSQTEVSNSSNADLYRPYLIIAGIVAVMFIIFALVPIPEIEAPAEAKAPRKSSEHERSILHERHYVLGIVSQFFYCFAQTGIFSLFIIYMVDKNNQHMPPLPGWLTDLLPGTMKYLHGSAWHITDYAGGVLFSCAFVFFTLGRLSGGFIVRYFPPHLTLGVYALVNVVLMLLIYLNLGWISVISLILSFFFMSIMYPTHFALAIRGMGERTKLAAAGMVTAIIGAGLGPIAMGWVADHFNMATTFLLPLACFVCIALYGFMWKSLFSGDMEPETEGVLVASH